MKVIQIKKDGSHSRKKPKSMIVILVIAALAAAAVLGIFIFRNLRQPQNYIAAVERDSAEMKTAELLSGGDEVFLFRYFTEDEWKTFTVFVSEYQAGKLTAKNKVAELSHEDMESDTEGMIALVPCFEEFKVKLIVADRHAKYAADFQILENAEGREYYGRAASGMEGRIPVRYDYEQGLAAFCYGKDGASGIPVQEMEKGNIQTDNEYIYYLSVQFGK